MTERFRFLVGVDQGREHEAIVLDAGGAILDRLRVSHCAEGIGKLIAWMQELSGDRMDQVAVATESPRGALVQACLGVGATVFALNPKQLDRFRDRHSASGAKDDARDAYVLADALRHDRHAFAPCTADDPMVAELRELGRMRDRLVEQQGRQSNQLQARLAEVWPELLDLSPAANEPWLWALLRKAPTPERARRLRLQTLKALLRSHRIRRFSAQQLRQTLQRPMLALDEGTWLAARLEIVMLSEVCAVTQQHIKRAEARIRKRLRQTVAAGEGEAGGGPYSDVQIVDSFPGVGIIVASRLIGEASHLLRSYQQLRIVSGAAPVTKSSGKLRQVIRRKACNARLNDALYHSARNAIKVDPGLRQRYDRIRSRGHSHGRGLRQLGDYLLRCLNAAMRDRTLYIPRPLLPENQERAA